VGPFYTRDEKRLISDFEELCANQQIMTFKIKGFGTFDDTRVVFIGIRPDESLDEFRWELSKKLRDYCNLRPYDLKRKFNFHATIAMKLGLDKFDEIKKYIETKPEPESNYCVMRVTLLKGQKILCEHDFFLRKLLGRREAKSRRILFESYKRLEKYLENSNVEVKKPYKGNVCFHCGKEFTELSFRCRYCGEIFCSDHHIPEVHECEGLPKPSWPKYRVEREKREPVKPVQEPTIRAPLPIEPPREYYRRREKTNWKAIASILVLIAIALCTYLVYMNYYATTSSSPNQPLPPSTPPNHTSVLPPNYYEYATRTYGNYQVHDIQALYYVLMISVSKLPNYVEGYFDCSEASARIEWMLEGYGFHARLYMSSLPSHTWVMAELDDGSWVAIESTLLTSNNYSRPGIIEGPNGEYREYSYLYQMYQDYLRQWGQGGYILPTSYDDFIHNYLQQPVFNPLAGLNYYSGTEFYESPEDAVYGNGLYHYPITEFDWWNVDPYTNTLR
jgi:hypothetical protein